jgi:hypothetical protein
MVLLVFHGGMTRTILAAKVNRIARMEEGTLPPKLKTMFPELAGHDKSKIEERQRRYPPGDGQFKVVAISSIQR